MMGKVRQFHLRRLAGLITLASLLLGVAVLASADAQGVRPSRSRDQAHVAVTAAAAASAGASRHWSSGSSAATGSFTHAMLTGSPVARIARTNVNSTVPAFLFKLVLHGLSATQLQLKSFEINPFSRRFDNAPLGGCRFCSGSGHFKSARVRGSTLTEGVAGKIILTSKTRFAEAVTRPGEIGRYKELGVAVNPSPRVFLFTEGCLAADAPLSNNDIFNRRSLPIVPCKQKVPFDSTNGFNFNAPSELNATTQQDASISGSVSGPRWLTLVEGRARCGPDPIAQVLRDQSPPVVWPIRGHFNVGFLTGKDTKPGFYCIYVQTGGRWKHIPDGRVTITGGFNYYAGDTVTISGPTSVPAPGDEVDNTFSGNASTSETLWTFDASSACASTAAAENASTASFGVGHVTVQGSFSQSVTSVPLTTPGTVFRCAYLNVGAPDSSGNPTGPTLASASYQVTVP